MKKHALIGLLCLVGLFAVWHPAVSAEPDSEAAYHQAIKPYHDITEISYVYASGGPPIPYPLVPASVVLKPDADVDTVPSVIFYRLAAWLDSQKFFDPEYAEREKDIENDKNRCSDCDHEGISVVRGGKRTTVWFTEYHGPGSDVLREDALREKFWLWEMVVRGTDQKIREWREREKKEQGILQRMKKSTTK